MPPHPLATVRWHGPCPSALPRNHRLPAAHRLELEPTAGTAPGPGGRDARLALLEAMLLASDEPLAPKKLATLVGLDGAADARRLVQKLHDLYDADGSAFQVEEVAGGYQLLTRAEFHPWLARLRRATAELKLSAAARETLTMVAYCQPITRADLEAIRGVQSGEMLRQLMEKGLIRIAGRHDSLGRPVLYGTTKKFLQLYGLRSLKDLEPLEGQGPRPEA
jgi:segregation and condensation protein B